MQHRRVVVLLLAAALAACDGDGAGAGSWQVVHRDLEGALLSVWGTSASDLWAVGGDAGTGPMVIHFDGTAWQRLPTGHQGDLWWVFGFAGGPIYLGGAGNTILLYDGTSFTPMTTPATTEPVTVFGIWGSSPADVWAVGGAIGGSSGAFAWRLEGDAWVAAPELPAGLAATDALWKAYGRGPDDVWFVGTHGLALHWDGASFTQTPTGVGESLFTVHANGDRFVTVGGYGAGYLLELDGTSWRNVTPSGAPSLAGVCLTEGGGFASGQYGAIYQRRGDAWQEEETGFSFEQVTLHSVWIDPDGGVWAAGGCVLCPTLVGGALVHKGDDVPSEGL